MVENAVLCTELEFLMHTAMVNRSIYREFLKFPVGGTGGIEVKSGMYIDSHLERCVLVQKAEMYPGEVCETKACVLHA